MKKLFPITLLVALMAALPVHADVVNTDVWINEFHYDNAGVDAGEFVEVVAPEGFDVSGLVIELYNSTTGGQYDEVSLGAFAQGDTVDGFTMYSFEFAPNGLQNGGADAIGLSSSDGTVLYQLLSYEGTMTPGGVGANWTTESTDVGVSESGATTVGSSLGLTGGPGNSYDDFTWTVFADAESPGSANPGQTFGIPEPASAMVIAMAAIAFCRRRR